MKVFIDDISNGLEIIKISYFNDIDCKAISADITYISDCVLTSDSLTEEYESVPLPCHCENNCSIDCSCMAANSIVEGKLVKNYTNNAGLPITECSDLCKCTYKCVNRTVQRGIQFPLQVFMTPAKGYGVRTLTFIPKSSFICEYAGEILDANEAEKRLLSQTIGGSNYVYVLREYSSKEKCTRTIIDPTYVGNVGRYLNHSCSPNLIPVPIRSNSMIPRICFFSMCDIEPAQELTYNYGVNSEGVQDNENIILKKCLCDSKNCIQFLPFNCNLLR